MPASSLTVAVKDVLRLEAAERATRREEAQQRMHSERLVAGAEVAEASERIADTRIFSSGNQSAISRQKLCRTIGSTTNGAPGTP